MQTLTATNTICIPGKCPSSAQRVGLSFCLLDGRKCRMRGTEPQSTSMVRRSRINLQFSTIVDRDGARTSTTAPSYAILDKRDIAQELRKEHAPMTIDFSPWRGFSPSFFTRFRRGAQLASLALSLAAASGLARAQQPASDRGLDPIRSYIAAGWDTLTRSMADCKSVVDPKLVAGSILYIPADLD